MTLLTKIIKMPEETTEDINTKMVELEEKTGESKLRHFVRFCEKELVRLNNKLRDRLP